MAYNSNIPQPTDQLSISQGDILGNFQALATLLNPNTGSVTFVNQAVAPTFPANQVGIYAKIPAAPLPLTTVSEWFVNKNINSGAGTKQIPFTASTLSTTANTNISPGNLSSGYTYLPSGIIIQWGTSGFGGSGLASNAAFPSAVTFPFQFPTQCIQVTATPRNTNSNLQCGSIYITSVTQTNFNGYASGTFNGNVGAPFQLSYVAIGY